MPIGIVQQATGTFEGNSGSVTVSATEAGSQVVILAGVVGTGVAGDVTSLSTPTGFSPLGLPSFGDLIDYARVQAFVKASASAGETSWTLTLTNSESRRVVWAALEMYGVDLDWPDSVYLSAATNSGTSSTVTSSAATQGSVSETFAGLSVAVFMATDTGGTTPSITGHTNGFNELATQSGTDSASRAATLSVATKQELTVNTPTTTVSVSPASYVGQYLLTFTGTDSRHAPNITAMFGAEIGTATNIATTGLGTATGTTAPWDTVTGSPAADATTPRSGSYSLQISATAAAADVAWTTGSGKNLKGSSISTWTERFHVRFPSSLPTGDLPIASVEAGSLANGLVIRYVSASQKLGVKIGTGSEVLCDATVSADTWIGVDYLYDPRTTTHTCQWQVDYNADTSDTTGPVAQSTASTSGMSAAAITTVRKGWTTTSTGTVRYDDIVGSRWRKTYPIGDMRILPLKVDPAGTPTVSGSSANFRTWTNNGTLAAWTATGTRTALDDMPPTIGATSDGLAQIANATTEYVEVPMETFTCAPGYVPVGGRWYWAGWAASGNPATLKFQPADGTSPAFGVLGETVDAGFDDTSLIWMSLVHNKSSALNSFYQLSQAMIDALAARFGFSEDTNPDAGVHAVLFELAVQPAAVIGTTEAEAGAFKIYLRQDPYSGAHVSYLGTTPAGSRGMTMFGTVNGVDWTQYVAANSTGERSIGAVSIAEITAGPGMTVDPT